MPGDRPTVGLMVAFVVLFALVTVAAVSPVEPIVGVFPFWSLLVLAAAVLTVVVAFVAVKTGWPTAVSER